MANTSSLLMQAWRTIIFKKEIPMSTTTHTARFVTTPSRRTGFVQWLLTLNAAHKSRIALANLDEKARRDVALTQSEVQIELSRPLWDVPSAWKCQKRT
jgi:uncharacterized protein YjiS (DUF1127 family)